MHGEVRNLNLVAARQLCTWEFQNGWALNGLHHQLRQNKDVWTCSQKGSVCTAMATPGGLVWILHLQQSAMQHSVWRKAILRQVLHKT